MDKQYNLVSKIETMPPVLESFHLYGLHGIKDITFDTDCSASILMARNGAGKTTFLSTINYVLSRRYHKIDELNFKLITFKLANGPTIRIEKSDAEAISIYIKNSNLMEFVRDSKSNIDKVFRAITSQASSGQSKLPTMDDELYELYRHHPTGSYRQFFEQILQFRKDLFAFVPAIELVDQELNRGLAEVEIVHLPTYRRIEMSLPSAAGGISRTNPYSRRASLNIPEDVKFGLSDITERLREISLEVQRISNTTYKRISANILNDLLDGSYRTQDHSFDMPERDELELFFDRLRGAQRSRHISDFTADFSIPDIDKIYSGNVDGDARPFLLYFLSNLNKAIRSTKTLEDRVNGFVEACNEYLQDEDSSAYVDGTVGPYNASGKKINISKDDFRPYFTGAGNEKRITIDALSSGEKQVVSLFARMYLYPKRKIVLYDEPELSLSMAWQAKLLPDVCKAGDFSQLIAITHSPFIFDNELDSFAKNLAVTPVQEWNQQSEYDFDDLLSELELDIDVNIEDLGEAES